MLKNSIRTITYYLAMASLAVGLAVLPASAQDSEYDILLGDNTHAGTGITDPGAASAGLDSLLAGKSPQRNNSIISQQGNYNTARQFTIGGRGNASVQFQNGNHNESNVLMQAAQDSGVYVNQQGDGHTSNISVLGATGVNVINLQSGQGKRSDVMVIGNAGVIIGNQIYLNDTGRPIRDVIVIGK